MNTPFKDAVVSAPSPRDGQGSVTNGADVLDGQKGTSGIMTEVTFVDVAGGPSVGSSGLDNAAGLLGSQTKKTSPDL
jgi:hypothetical protein